MRTILVFVLILFPLRIGAQQVTVSGNAPDYAGCVLTFFVEDNYIDRIEVKSEECTVAADGSFSCTFPCKDTRLIYLHLGVFKARFFAQPGFRYEVKLPPRTDVTTEEASSPFFEEVTVWLTILSTRDNQGKAVASEEELNMRIIRFDEGFNPMYDRLAVDAAKRKTVKADSVVRVLKESMPRTNDRYFDDYAFYRTGLLYFAAQQNGVKYISNAYFAGKPVLYDNEAYMDLFGATYDKYFMYFGRTKEGEIIYDAINIRKSFSELKRLLGRDGILPSDDLRELVILKNIHDEFYSDRFSRQSLLELLDSAIVQTRIERHKEIAGQIRSKITKLLRGFAPPEFSLRNQDDKLVSPETYKGKYLYLMFCTTQNYVCLSQYELLEELYRTHGKWLQIAVISADENYTDMCDFRRKNGYEWDFLHYAGDPDILKKYDIRIFPTCYLIDPDGKLALSPAPAANDNLERALYRELSGKGLWDEYIRKGLIEDKKRTDKRFDLDLGIPAK